MVRTALATDSGSWEFKGLGVPFATAQKEQLRVQISPMIRKVAVFSAQQWPILGQRAL